MSAKVRVRHIDPKVRARIRRAVLRHNLDRRYVYTVFPDGSGCLATFEHYSVPCLGCTVSDKCRECGGHGYRQTWDLNKIEHVAIKPDKADQLAAIARAKYAIGDTIHFVGYRVVSPAHELMGSRMVQVRYYAETETVRSAFGLSGGDFASNHSVLSSDIYPTLEDAQKAAADRQRKHDEALKFARGAAKVGNHQIR